MVVPNVYVGKVLPDVCLAKTSAWSRTEKPVLPKILVQCSGPDLASRSRSRGGNALKL